MYSNNINCVSDHNHEIYIIKIQITVISFGVQEPFFSPQLRCRLSGPTARKRTAKKSQLNSSSA